MYVCINGKVIPQAEAQVSVFDRGFMYGDGLFETLRVYQGRPFLWEEHLQRLRNTAKFLNLELPCHHQTLLEWVQELIQMNRFPEGLLRIQLSRGPGPRGYSPARVAAATLVISLHPTQQSGVKNSPKKKKLKTTSLHVYSHDPLLHYKTTNRLMNVLASAEVGHSGVEALFLNEKNEVTESVNSNVFWISGSELCTAPTDCGLLPGITRKLILDICPSVGLIPIEKKAQLKTLLNADAVFLTLSSQGIVAVSQIDGRHVASSNHTQHLYQAYLAKVSAYLASDNAD
jgi:4-amino-4-deoxychorismate lyase